MAVEFTQYLRPNGRQRKVSIELTKELEAKALRIIQEGFKFEIEELTTGEVSMTCEDEDGLADGPIAHLICPNGPEVPQKVAELIQTAYDKVT